MKNSETPFLQGRRICLRRLSEADADAWTTSGRGRCSPALLIFSCGEAGSGAAGDKSQASQGGMDFWIVKVSAAPDAYEVDNGYYPKGKNGLLDLIQQPRDSQNWRGPYIQSDTIPKDPWGNDYVLVNPGEHGAYDLLSAGPDGEMGTEDDITNWGLSKKKK